MKRFICFLVLLCTIFVICGCDANTKQTETRISVESLEILSNQVGIKLTLPESARIPEFYNVNDIIAEITFSADGYSYTYRASKIASGAGLSDVIENYEAKSDIIINDEITGVIFDIKDGSRYVCWDEGGTHKMLMCQKYIAESWFVNLCDDL